MPAFCCSTPSQSSQNSQQGVPSISRLLKIVSRRFNCIFLIKITRIIVLYVICCFHTRQENFQRALAPGGSNAALPSGLAHEMDSKTQVESTTKKEARSSNGCESMAAIISPSMLFVSDTPESPHSITTRPWASDPFNIDGTLDGVCKIFPPPSFNNWTIVSRFC